MDRIRGRYLIRFILKIEKENSFAAAKKLLQEHFDRLHALSEFRPVEWMVDVDAQ